mmetsp:Transcript_1502/g.2736  ORF Transcript_1502/g.2736 Transcript_1502/m.2736 type:complete len:203 (-) Transcript_1502:507-1115(-)
MRIPLIVYSSRNTGYLRGPPTKGDASGEDSGKPNNSPCLKVATFSLFPKASNKDEGTSTLDPPPNTLPSNPPAAFFLSLSLSLDPPTISTGKTAIFIPFFKDLLVEVTSFVATLMASIMTPLIFSFSAKSLSSILLARLAAIDCSTPSTKTQIKLLTESASFTAVEEHQVPRDFAADSGSSVGSNNVLARAPATSKEPPFEF